MNEILTDLSMPALQNAIQDNAFAFFLRRERILGKTSSQDGDITWLEAAANPPVAWLHGWITPSEVFARAAQTSARCTVRGHAEAYLVALETRQCRTAWQAVKASQIESEHILVAPLSEAGKSRPFPHGLHIERVLSDAELQECASVISTGRDQWAAGFFKLTNPSISACQESMRFYLARMGDCPVATAAQFFNGGLAAVWWVTTIPNYRRRGVSTAIMRAALADAARLGYLAAMVEAPPDAVPMYRRLGFAEVGFINVYRWRHGGKRISG